MAYSRGFYTERHGNTVYSANTILSVLLDRIPALASAVDIGCGVGTWLSVLHEKGVEDIPGVDGDWVDRDLLVIPGTCFKQVDLSDFAGLPRRYDLAISLEVAEHLPADRSEGFVLMLTELADHVLFSAAVPHQGGMSHVNEQWQDFWVELFSALNYDVHDFIRPVIWNDDRIPLWYRHNILFFSKRQYFGDVLADAANRHTGLMPLDVVHPELYLSKVNPQVGVKGSFRLFCKALQNYVRRKPTHDG